MRTGRPKQPLTLTDDARRTLAQWARRPKTAQRLALRARVVLACAEGLPNRMVAAHVHASYHSVGKWRERFRVRRLEGLIDEPRPGAPRTVTELGACSDYSDTLLASIGELRRFDRTS